MADPLGTRTWTDVASGAAAHGASNDGRVAPVVVVAIGSFEQHGPHLPLHTDTVISTALAAGLCERVMTCALGPALTVSASGEHEGFPGTLSIGTAATTDVLVELVRSADWARGVVFVNGHGGNAVALRRARDVLAGEQRRVLAWSPHVPGGDLHAGRTETSLMLHLAPGEVRLAAAAAGPTPTLAELVGRGVRPLSPNGVLGDPTGASADEGGVLFARLVDELVAAVDAWLT